MKKWIFLSLFLNGTMLLGQKRLALIIGNANYESSVLRNPRHDAEDMAAAAKQCGFELVVPVVFDADKETMERAIVAFQTAIQAAPDAIRLFYFSGHGVQLDGKNYLLGVKNRSLQDRPALKNRGGLLLDEVLERMHTEAGCNLVILDACRNNPLPVGLDKGGERGLTTVETGAGTIVMYATAANATADDGSGRNGVFTAALKLNWVKQGWTLTQIFQETAKTVSANTNRQQNPELSIKYYDELVLRPAAPKPVNLALQDSDGDGVVDSKDACPYEYGELENRGCPKPKPSVAPAQPTYTPPQPAVGSERDSDGDGTPDKKDKCPNEFGEPEDGGCPNYSPIELLAIRAIDSAKRVGAEELSLNDLELKRLPSSIKSLTQLKKLNLASNQISDLSALKMLTNLTNLNLEGNGISDISDIKTLTNLIRLRLSSNQISNILALKNLTQLQELDLGFTPISDISALKGLPQLNELRLSSTQISDMSIFKNLNLSQLRTLRVSYNKISNLSALRYLEQLETLVLVGTQISDASEIEALNLKQLTYLALQNNNIQNFNVNLKVFPKLQNLFLSGNPIQNIPKEIIGERLSDNCFEALRAYQAKQKR